jgi:uncharacterized membrane protein YdjX (TVP38/TMEM64 family)
MRARLILLLLLILISAAMLAQYSGLSDWFDLDTVGAYRNELLTWAEERPFLAAFLFVAGYAGVVALSLPAASVLTLLGGFLFGRWLGTALIVTAATLGAVVVFWIATTSLGAGLRDRAGPFYQKVERNMQENAFGYLLFLRLVPVFPFFLVNIVPALFRIRTRTFALATLLGIIPGTFVYANLGRELGSISSLQDLVSKQTLVAFSLLGVMALIPSIYRQWNARAQPGHRCGVSRAHAPQDPS